MRQVDIEGFEDYQVNDSGINEQTVWSKKTKKWMKPWLLHTETLIMDLNGLINKRYLI